MTNRDVIETWFRRVWKEEDANAIDELFVMDGQALGLGANVLYGPEDFRIFHSALCSLLCDIEITIDKSMESEDWISAVCTLNAKAERTKTPVLITGSIMVRIADEKLVEAYNHWDFLALYTQLGLLPAKTFELGLSGERIV